MSSFDEAKISISVIEKDKRLRLVIGGRAANVVAPARI